MWDYIIVTSRHNGVYGFPILGRDRWVFHFIEYDEIEKTTFWNEEPDEYGN